MKKLYALLFLIGLLASCADKQPGGNSDTPAEELSVTDTSGAASVFIRFYKWYRDHQNLQNCLLKNSCDPSAVYDSTKYFAVDFAATEKYLAAIKSSGCVSEQYLSHWRKYFKECDEQFKKNPSADGVPDGFDYDFVTNSQDFEEELNTVENAKAVKATGDATKLTLIMQFKTGAQRTVDLSKAGGQWLIDKIY